MRVSPLKCLCPPKEDEDEDEERAGDKPEDEDKPPFPPKKELKIGEVELLLFSSVKELSSMISGYHGETDEVRKEVKDLGNQTVQLQQKIGNIEDSLRRIEQYFGQLVRRQPASKAPTTTYEGGNPLIDASIDNNHKQQEAPKPVFNQLKDNGVIIPTISDTSE